MIVGHNVAFDMRFFAAAGPRCGVVFANPVLDTLLLECEINVNQEDKSLEANRATAWPFRSPGDTPRWATRLTTAEIFIALIPLLSQRGIGTLGEALQGVSKQPFRPLDRMMLAVRLWAAITRSGRAR